MHYIVLYPQNGDRIVTTDSVMSLCPMYTLSLVIDAAAARGVVCGSMSRRAN